MEHWQNIMLFSLEYGAYLSLVLSVIIIVTLMINPQIWFKNYPPQAQESADPVSDSSKRLTLLVGIPFILIMLFTPVYAVFTYQASNPASFFDMLMVSFVVGTCFNLVDTVIVDIGIGVWIDPKFARLPGTENGPSYQTVSFHLKAFAQGLVFSLIFSAVIAAGFVYFR